MKTIIKVGISTAWLLSTVALVMLLFANDGYGRGYEDMVSDAANIFLAGLATAACAVVIAALMRRRNQTAVSRGWLTFGTIHVALSLLLVAAILILTRLS